LTTILAKDYNKGAKQKRPKKTRQKGEKK